MTNRTIAMDEDFEEILNCAVRYALGRRTYVVSDVCSYVTKFLPDMSIKWLVNLRNSIDFAREDEFSDKPLGDACDVTEWEKLYNNINNELGRRNK